jgi:hypothetical protein
MENQNELSNKQAPSCVQLIAETCKAAEKVINEYMNNPIAPVSAFRPSVGVMEEVPLISWRRYRHCSWELIGASLNRRAPDRTFWRADSQEQNLLIDTERRLAPLRKRLKILLAAQEKLARLDKLYPAT